MSHKVTCPVHGLLAEPGQRCAECEYTVKGVGGITRVFRTKILERAPDESPIGAFRCYAAGDYRTYNVDGSSLGTYQTESEAFSAVWANNGRSGRPEVAVSGCLLDRRPLTRAPRRRVCTG